MKIVAILHRSAGNDTVGDMWKETKIFEDTMPISSIFEWARSIDQNLYKIHLEITVAQE